LVLALVTAALPYLAQELTALSLGGRRGRQRLLEAGLAGLQLHAERAPAVFCFHLGQVGGLPQYGANTSSSANVK